MSENQLAKFQALLLNTLYECEKAEDIFAILQKDPLSEPYIGWLNQMNPSMVEVGAELVKKWGVKLEVFSE